MQEHNQPTTAADRIDAPRASGCILIVEDEVLLQMLAADTLAEVGLHVEVSGTGSDALAKLRPRSFEAAVVDIGLPDRKGATLINEMRAMDADMPIIIASGQDVSELRHTFRNDAKIAVLPKPYTTEALIAALRALGVHIPKEPS